MMHDYYRRRAEGVILEFIRGIKKRASLNWALGCLREMLEHGMLSLSDILEIIEEIEGNPSLYLLDRFPERKERLKILKHELKRIIKG